MTEFWRNRPFLIVAILLVAAAMFFSSNFDLKKNGSGSVPGGDEIERIKSTTNLAEQAVLYKKLIERVGVAQAQEDLVRSGMPFTGQTHLLNHTAGDYLYEKFGVTGLTQCKEYFLASCYHGFILNAIATGGIPEVARVMEACRNQDVYTVFPQCSHAVGHGFLAYIGYKNLTRALTMCDDMVNSVSGFPTFNCHDGVFMENIWAVHDGSPSSDRWVKDTDPVYPCNDPRINEKYLLACWSNQPSLMYQQFHGDIRKVGDQCGKIKQTNLMEMCYNGLSRQIHPIAGGNIDKTFDLCGQLGGKWVDFCIIVNETASFSVGDRSLPFAICQRINAESRDSCYQGLVGMINIYAKSSAEQTDWCNKIDNQTWRERCLAQQQR